MTEKNEKYSAKNIEILTGRQAVRRRPGMYIGNTKCALEHVCRELVANSIDRYLAGHGSIVRIEFTRKGIRVSDDADGVPIVRKNGDFDDSIFNLLHTGPTSDNHAPHIHLTSHGCGLAPLNFLAKRMKVLTWRDDLLTGDRFEWNVKYDCGELIEQSSKRGEGKGTVVEWEPDLKILGRLETRKGMMRQEIWDAAHLFSGLRFEFDGERFRTKNGLLDLAWLYRRSVSVFANETAPLHFSETVDHIRVEVAAISDPSEEETVLGWVNGARTSRGSHIDGLASALAGTNYRVGLVHVLMLAPAFAGPVKDELLNRNVEKIVEELVRRNLPNLT